MLARGCWNRRARHAYLASLLRIPHVVLAVNKMDEVGWSEGVYERIRDEFLGLTKNSGFVDVHAIPVSALNGDNVVDPSKHTPYYDGPPLLRYLENIEVARPSVPERARLPVQLVLRPSDPKLQDYRAYAGEVTSGVFRPGDTVVVLPSNKTSTIAAIDRYGEPVDEAFAPMSVAIRLTDDVDAGRGAIIASAGRPPRVSQELSARLCWMAERPLQPRARRPGPPRSGFGTRHRDRHRLAGEHSHLHRSTCAASARAQRHRHGPHQDRASPSVSTATPTSAPRVRSSWSTRQPTAQWRPA